MRLLATRKQHQNTAALDPWTLVHLAAGLALGLTRVRRPRALAAAALYELAEQAFERYPPGRALFETSGPEHLPNVLADLAALLVGHWLGERWNRT